MSDVEKIYDRMAAEYDRHITPSRMCQFFALVHELDLSGGEKVLDIGSGPGVLSLHLARQLGNGEVIGVDLSGRMVELAAAKARGSGVSNARFIQGDAMNLQFPDKAFDVVVSSYLVHWVPDLSRFFSEVQRVLKRGGKLGIIAPAPDRYSELREAFRVVTRRRHSFDGRSRAGEMTGLRLLAEEDLLETVRATGLSIQRDLQISLKERLPPEAYLRRINAITDERYLEFFPQEEREGLCAELMQELVKRHRADAFTTECSIIVIARRGT